MAPQVQLTEDYLSVLEIKCESVDEEERTVAREHLLRVLKKSLVIGGDTGKRSTFTLCYDFVQQENNKALQRRQNKRILNFKYGRHLSLKHLVPNYDFAIAVTKHIDRILQREQRYINPPPRAIDPTR